jgi:hypothetical protein
MLRDLFGDALLQRRRQAKGGVEAVHGDELAFDLALDLAEVGETPADQSLAECAG